MTDAYPLAIRRIGIALAVYEPRIDFFVEQLRSLAAQTFTAWTCAITFDSPAAAVVTHPDVERLIADPRFRWAENPKRLGAAKNFERAIQRALEADVDAIACCDYDDRWYPDKLDTLATALGEAGAMALVHSDLELFDASGPIGSAWRIERRRPDHVAPWQLLVRNVVTGCSMLFDAALARRYPEVPVEARLHDRWYALAAACHGGVRPVARPLVAYRVHRAQHTGVARYRGLLVPPPGVRGPSAFLRECVRVWRNARELARAAIDRGMPVPTRDRSLYGRADLGLDLMLAAARQLRGDPVLARAAAAAAIGKLASALTRDGIAPFPERTAVPPA